MNNISWPAAKEFVRSKKMVILAFLFLCFVASALFGLKRVKTATVNSMEKVEAQQQYEKILRDYDAALAEAVEARDVIKDSVAITEQFLGESEYMKLNPLAVFVGQTEYCLSTVDDANVAEIVRALNEYVMSGGLIADIQNSNAGENVKCWQELLSTRVNEQYYSVSILSKSREEAENRIQIIDNCIKGYVQTIAAIYGRFELRKINDTFFVIADENVAAKQNSKKNELSGQLQVLADAENVVIYYEGIRGNHLDSAPSFSAEKPVIAFLKGFVTVMVAGIAGLCVVLWIILRFDGIVRGIADVERYDCSVFGTFSKKKGFDPEAARIAMDVELVSRAKGRDSLFIADLGDEKESAEPMEQLSKALKDKGLLVEAGHDPAMKADHLEQMVKAGQCVLFVRCGLTKNVKIQEFNEVCKKYGIDVIGTIAMM